MEGSGKLSVGSGGEGFVEGGADGEVLGVPAEGLGPDGVGLCLRVGGGLDVVFLGVGAAVLVSSSAEGEPLAVPASSDGLASGVGESRLVSGDGSVRTGSPAGCRPAAPRPRPTALPPRGAWARRAGGWG